MNRKILIITYYWPTAGGPGVQRWLKFASYLPQEGITPVVYCPENACYPIVDPSLKDDIPGIKVIKQPIFEPLKLANTLFKTKKLSAGFVSSQKSTLLQNSLIWLRGNLFIPDSRKYWVHPSVKFLKTYIREHNINTVITTGPPHSMHLIGLELKERSNVNWLADFRDPWTTIGYHQSLKLGKHAINKHLKLEHRVLNQADVITVTSPKTLEEFKSKTQRPVRLLTNGFDAKDFSETTTLSEKFSVAHIGSMLPERNPKVLWEILSKLTKNNRCFASDLELNLMGIVSGEVLKSLEYYGLMPFVKAQGYTSHQDAVNAMKRSQVLLLIEVDHEDTSAIVPGKLFEYMAAQRPIVGIGPEEWTVSTIIKSGNVGKIFNYLQKDKLQDHFLSLYKSYENKTLLKPYDISQYERHNLTKQLVNILKNDLWV